MQNCCNSLASISILRLQLSSIPTVNLAQKNCAIKMRPKVSSWLLLDQNDLLHYILTLELNFKATACQQEFVRGCLGVLFLAFHFAVMSTGCWLLMLPRLHGEPNPKVPMFQKVCGIDRCSGFSSQEREIPCCCFLFGDGEHTALSVTWTYRKVKAVKFWEPSNTSQK